MSKLLQEINRSKVLAGILTESDVYFSTFSEAVQTARKAVESKGYIVDEQDWFIQINTGQGKPKEGKTTSASIGLTKDGKPSRKALHIQVYNRGNNVTQNYELNFYIA